MCILDLLNKATLTYSIFIGEDTKQPQCRIHISAEGFEWFMHNRTNAYENILSQLIAVDSPFLKAKSHDSNAYSLASTRGGQQTVSARCKFKVVAI